MEDCLMIPGKLEKLMQWSGAWLMDFNTDKCKVMHFGNKNIKHAYKMFSNPLFELQDKNTVVMIIVYLKQAKQCMAPYDSTHNFSNHNQTYKQYDERHYICPLQRPGQATFRIRCSDLITRVYESRKRKKECKKEQQN